MKNKVIGLRVDVDTYRGTRQGVPNLLRIFNKHKIKGTFYFSVGPDNMGRHLWRMLKPAFAWKMLRTNAAGLYGPEIILMGTAWPGLLIGKRLGGVIKAAYDDGQEIGLHAWDHHRIQAKVDKMSPEQIRQSLKKGVDCLTQICGKPPVSSAVPGWRCTDTLLSEKAGFPFKYNSDCRGTHIFRPVLDGKKLDQLQVPVTMPTYDEVVGRNGITDDNYNEFMLEQLKPEQLNVLTIHAEAEGGKCQHMFDEYLTLAIRDGWSFCPLGELAAEAGEAPEGHIAQEPFPGREGWLGVQR
ncbi:4-deoxy-4-formamido-L-arabinose-phosphoundecaprenol deformylase [Lentisphaerota bacterium ZTH]|nr:4-deoxy-4-formamido-L-arabinose-phosphoundecaprenol deformylase [Lentisphaerota bacterium]WET06637.1 4-deoxy-4-formamido-L-arabinose-phosphoundecaprenol deformylase [Lentisphaerota bacterium ZTH]